ncbi:MAG: right-handed parallel beta-helix repeat-containing protein [Syntrophaceae bacterium]|nr:right-handed parallel beta-helix repeat-containing protein [Syntrophaceae bacterium]
MKIYHMSKKSVGHSYFSVVFILLFCCALNGVLATALYGAILTSAQKVDWENNAGVQYTIPTYTEVVCTPSDSTGATDMSSEIQACLDGASDYTAIKLPAGTYRIETSITVPSYKVLKGSGTSTKLMLYGANITVAIEGSSTFITTTMAAGAVNWTKGSKTISVTDASSFSENDYIMVRQSNLSSCANANCTYSGTHTGVDGEASLTDSARAWVVNEWVGYKIMNYTGFSEGIISANTGTSVTASMSTNYSPAGRTTWNTGDKYYIYPANNNYVIPVLKEGYDYVANTTSQIVKITGIVGNDITISRPLYATYHSSMSPNILKVSPKVDAGIEDLYVEKDDNNGSNLYIDKAANCWVRGVESYMTKNYHVYLSRSYGCIIRDSYFHGSWYYGGNSGYGVAMFNNSTDNLVENNIFFECRHSLEMEIGCNGNIYGYNYSKDPIESLPLDALTLDACVHGGSNYMNLYEGNIVAHMGIDNATGGSRHITFLRNWATRDHTDWDDISYPRAVDVQKNALFTNLIGNVYNTAGKNSTYTVIWGWDQAGQQTPFDTRSKSTCTQCGNWDLYTGAYHTDNAACGEAIPNSYYRTSKPSFFIADDPWPAIGPDLNPKVSAIPAQRRYYAPLTPVNFGVSN